MDDYLWIGFGESKVNKDVRPAKTLWDWLKLLIIPAVLAIGGYLFTRFELAEVSSSLCGSKFR